MEFWPPQGCVGLKCVSPPPKARLSLIAPTKLNYFRLVNMPAIFHRSTHWAQKLALWEGLIWRINRMSFKNAKMNLFSEIREEKIEK